MLVPFLTSLKEDTLDPFLNSMRAVTDKLELQASTCSSHGVFAALDRLGLIARRDQEVPCCLAPDPSLMPAVLRSFE